MITIQNNLELLGFGWPWIQKLAINYNMKGTYTYVGMFVGDKSHLTGSVYGIKMPLPLDLKYCSNMPIPENSVALLPLLFLHHQTYIPISIYLIMW